MNSLDRYNAWLNSDYISEIDKQELISIKNNSNEIEDRFCKDLGFGTGGLRGVMGVGTNRINVYTVRKATQGVANYIKKLDKKSGAKGVVIAYDSRNNSGVFAKEAALVLAGNDIKAYLFKSLRSTPELSFAVRHLNCAAGIVITASHNPPKYNGYKVYNQHGGQITLEYAKGVISEINKVDDWSRINRAYEQLSKESGLFEIIGKEVDDAYINKVVELVKEKRLARNQLDLKIVYTPLHGTGLMPISECLSKLGYKNVYIVKSQAQPDGNFSTVKSPNPEEHAAFEKGIELAEEVGADIVLGTDPDCDRVGVAVKNDKGEYRVMTGNQMGALLVDYIIKATPEISEKHTVIKTIVTSELGANIAKLHGATVVNTLTGFKFIGKKIREFEEAKQHEFLFGYEESYGYLCGTFVRDKDAVIACALISDMASYYKQQGKNLYNALHDIYKEYGYYVDALDTFVFEGANGAKKMQNIMSKLRNQDELKKTFKDIERVEDYITKTTQYKDGDIKTNIDLPKADVIKMIFEDGSWLAVRPSGTEPKLKVYYSVVGQLQSEAEDRAYNFKKSISSFIE